MQLIDVLSPDRVLADAELASRKRVLAELAELIAGEDNDVSARDVFESICAREQIGSTTLGNGIAIPHGRLKKPGFASGALIRLNQPVDFDADDNQPVDLVFAVVTSEETASQQMELLSRLEEKLRDAQFLAALRRAGDAVELFNLITDGQAESAHA